ncbi:MAG: prepilin-type N-terminal cleavage/methylation domain-containing protein [Clostridiaceae bacterium]|nr:prepilin-type N-terminal cleavage/methylation domain-containing protein [Clostridiaceae bacterium]
MKKVRSRNGFTLAELIMAVALLVLFSTFIVKMFVQADKITKKAQDLDQVVAFSSDLADQWRAGQEVKTMPILAGADQNLESGSRVTVPVNRDFQPCAPDQARYMVVMALTELTPVGGTASAGRLWQIQIEVSYADAVDQPPIYKLKAGRYKTDTEEQP